jgi:hypothetical protein
VSEDVLAMIDGAISDWRTSSDAMRHVPDEARWDRRGVDFGRTNPMTIGVQFAAFSRAYRDAMTSMVRTLSKMARDIAPALEKYQALTRVGVAPRSVGPPPLCVNGREYHRRQQARRCRR